MFNDITDFQCKLIALTALYMLLALVYVALLVSIRNKNKYRFYRFYFCDNSTRKIISVEPVSYRAYKHYDELYSYPVMHISDNAIYFNCGENV